MTLCHQVSLRISEEHKRAIRQKLHEMKSKATNPEDVTEADAHRALLDEAKAKNQQETHQ